MDFDEWMLAKDPKYHPSDDTVSLRNLRECWVAAQTSLGEYDMSGVIHLTHNKAKHIISQRNYLVTGFVLTDTEGRKCLVDMSAVRWFDEKQDFHRMMHPN